MSKTPKFYTLEEVARMVYLGKISKQAVLKRVKNKKIPGIKISDHLYCVPEWWVNKQLAKIAAAMVDPEAADA